MGHEWLGGLGFPCKVGRSYFLFFFFVKFIYLFIFLAARRLSLVAANRRLLFVSVHGLLIAVASLVAEHWL